MNATLRDNILFGEDNDEKKYGLFSCTSQPRRSLPVSYVCRFDSIVQACCLEHDIEVLPHGVETEIGERGINLSGESSQSRKNSQ